MRDVEGRGGCKRGFMRREVVLEGGDERSDDDRREDASLDVRGFQDEKVDIHRRRNCRELDVP
jgi:hypothetical protein